MKDKNTNYCPKCKTIKNKKEFVRYDGETGMIEDDFVYCNSCVGHIDEEKM